MSPHRSMGRKEENQPDKNKNIKAQGAEKAGKWVQGNVCIERGKAGSF